MEGLAFQIMVHGTEWRLMVMEMVQNDAYKKNAEKIAGSSGITTETIIASSDIIIDQLITLFNCIT